MKNVFSINRPHNAASQEDVINTLGQAFESPDGVGSSVVTEQDGFDRIDFQYIADVAGTGESYALIYNEKELSAQELRELLTPLGVEVVE